LKKEVGRWLIRKQLVENFTGAQIQWRSGTDLLSLKNAYSGKISREKRGKEN
jgi:hypothetical protein